MVCDIIDLTITFFLENRKKWSDFRVVETLVTSAFKQHLNRGLDKFFPVFRILKNTVVLWLRWTL